jgi:ABC-type multidrug transport system permease subunit
MICDLPNKIGTAILFDLAIYFMTNLRRTPGHFFIFLLFTFTCTLTMSMYFRSIAALSRTLSQAMAPAAIFILALIIYTGFAIPTRDMHPWFRWINWLDPVAYAFEALMINEVSSRIYAISVKDLANDHSFTAAIFHALCSSHLAQAMIMFLLNKKSALRQEPLLARVL